MAAQHTGKCEFKGGSVEDRALLDVLDDSLHCKEGCEEVGPGGSPVLPAKE